MKKILSLLMVSFWLLASCHSQPGTVVLITGTPSTGKSTFCSYLLKQMGENWKYLPISEISDATTEYYSAKKYEYYHLHPENIALLKNAINLANSGFNVLCDTIIGTEKDFNRVQDFIGELNKQKIPNYTILIKCDMVTLIKRVTSRNLRATSPNATTQEKAELRSPLYPIRNFAAIYKKRTSQSEQPIGTITRTIIRDICQHKKFDYWCFAYWCNVIAKRNGSPEMTDVEFNRLENELIYNLGFTDDEETIELTPVYPSYDFIVDTNTEINPAKYTATAYAFLVAKMAHDQRK